MKNILSIIINSLALHTTAYIIFFDASGAAIFFIYSVMIPITASILLLCNSKFGKKEKILESTSMQSSIIYLFLFRRQFEKSHCSYYNDLNILKVLILEHFLGGRVRYFTEAIT